MSDDAPKINMRENGPFLAKNVTDLTSPDGKAIGTKPLMPLCRCGASSNKPFCDGSHRETGWTSDGQADDPKGRLKHYEGDALTVHYNPLICSHAGKCVATSREAFNTDNTPWIDANQPEEVLKAACAACPSGALSWTAKNGEAMNHAAADGTGIRIDKGGPLEVTGIPLDEDVVWGEGATEQKYVLCRCGKSGNKPFCDGSHADHDWDSTVTATEA